MRLDHENNAPYTVILKGKVAAKKRHLKVCYLIKTSDIFTITE
jgi:hypothetical protein